MVGEGFVVIKHTVLERIVANYFILHSQALLLMPHEQKKKKKKKKEREREEGKKTKQIAR